MTEPGRLERWLLGLLGGPEGEFVVGDLLERYADEVAAGTAPAIARARLRRRTLRSILQWWRPSAVRARRRARGGSVGLTIHGNERGSGRAGEGWGMGTVIQDVRTAWRGLRKRSGFAAGVVLTLGLGIGATTTIFSVVDGVLFRPLDFEDPERLVAVGTTFPGREWVEGADQLMHLAGSSLLNFQDLKERSRSFDGLAAVEVTSVLLPDRGNGPELAPAAAVTPEFFDVLRVGPALGRGFLPEEYRRASGVYLITHGAWIRRFGGDPAAVGAPIDNIGTPAVIVGVLPESFRPPEGLFSTVPDYWGPMELDHPRYESRGRRSVTMVGRLAPDVSVEQAREEASLIAVDLARDFPDGNVYPDGSWFGIGVNGLHEHTIGSTGRTLWIFLSASGMLLLLATLNAATLLLARSLDRIRELSVRVALGAGRARILRLLVTEAGLLAVGGGLVGVGLAYGGVAAFLAYAPVTIPRTDMVAVDGRILLLAAVVSVGTGLLAGLVPALRLTSRTPWTRIQSVGRGAEGSSSRLRSLLVGGQIALAVVLLSGAGLLLNSFIQIRSVAPGFEPEGLSSMNVALKRPGAPDGEELWEAWDLALGHAGSVTGVEAVAGTSNPPYQGPFSAPRLLLPDDPPDFWREGIAGYSVTPGYFETVGTRLRSGRDFERADGPDAEPVAIVNEAFVREVLAGADPYTVPLRHVEGEESRTLRVVGVVEDVVQGRGEEGKRPAIYFPYTQAPWSFVQVVVRSELAPEVLVPELRRAMAAFNPYVPPRDVQTLEQRMASTTRAPRFQAMLIGAFAAVAILLAAAGLYGSLAHAVGRRTRELGVRMALGAARTGLLWMVLGSGMRLALVGLGVGLIGAVLATRVLEGFLYGVSPTDPLTLAGVAALLLVVAAVASLLPARRATGIDPVTVLKSE